MIAAVSGQLFYRLVVRKNIAVNTAKQRDRNFKDRNEQMIRRIADRSLTHTARPKYNMPAIYMKNSKVITIKVGIRIAPE